MPHSKEREQILAKPVSTIIGQGVTIQTEKLSGTESVRIDGNFRGDIELDGYLHIGANGRVMGNLHVSIAKIEGRVKGNVTCRDMVELTATASLQGDIYTGTIVVQEGAKLNGLCSTSARNEDAIKHANKSA
jgi:cytoskeletal protein CcmA (bactofilin family)